MLVYHGWLIRLLLTLNHTLFRNLQKLGIDKLGSYDKEKWRKYEKRWGKKGGLQA